MIRFAAAASLAAASLVATPALAAERDFPVGGFDRLEVAGSQEVAVATGRAPSVRASGSAEDLDRLDIHVEGGTLVVGTKRGMGWSWRDRGKVRIAVTVPMLRGIEVAGSGAVAVDRIKVRDFTAELSGSGSLRIAALDTGKASFATAGSGSIEAAGRCDSGEAETAGSGSIRIARLRCTTLSASTAGSGTIDAFASRTATLSTVGSGDINLAGGARCTVSTAGSGKARCS